MLQHLSLCTGYGGIDIALKNLIGNIEAIAYSEIEAYAIENLISKMEQGLLDPAPIYTDLKTFPWEMLQGKVDILSGGFPCQPFSLGATGSRKMDNDPRHLWPYIVKGIVGLDFPPIVFFENVEGIISAKLKADIWRDPQGTSVLLHVLRELERLGYVANAGIFSAEEVGAPHLRKRVFIMGVHPNISKASIEYLTQLILSSETLEPRWPSRPTETQYSWEPPKLVPREARIKGEVSKVLNEKDLNNAYANTMSEFKLLGNGVVPQVAEKAFKHLWLDACAYLK